MRATTEKVFSANGKVYKQIDGVSMRGPLSVVFFLNHIEEKVVVPQNPLFYLRYVDDAYFRKKKSKDNVFFNALNSFHENIKLTIEVNFTVLTEMSAGD